MENNSTEITEALNHLITIANDGQYGYSSAAEDAKDPLLKAVFLRLSAERAEFATELRLLVREAGGTPDEGGGPVGALHRTWMDIKTALSSNDNKAVVNECIKGDQTAVAAYERTLNEALLTPTQRQILENQLKLVKDALFSLESEAAKLN